MRVLVADDIPAVSDIIARMCQRNGWEVIVCNTGSQVMPTLEWMRPDVLLLDIGMPEMDGLQVAEALQLRPDLRPRRMIAITGYDDVVMRKKIAALGFDHHLVKPITWSDLSAAMSPPDGIAAAAGGHARDR
jgi:CheY-like chemotaxis protein